MTDTAKNGNLINNPDWVRATLRKHVWLPEGCPDRAKHTPCPSGYTAWFTWAERMGKTRKQTRCSTCGLLSIWVPK